MKIYPREPDLKTIYRRFESGEIELQPDFQRDLVWNLPKKQSLIDTILRGWHFPPVFLVVHSSSARLDVLDGQQRLNAIFEFFQGEFPVDGMIEPRDEHIESLNGLRYEQLPISIRAEFDRYSIRVCELYDYREDEPYELFFRLNQGSVLTPSEKRNTLYGPIREQVKELVHLMAECGLSIDKIGFNNNRLSYEDVVSRLLYVLQFRDISRKITDQLLVDFFRSPTGVDRPVMECATKAIITLGSVIEKKLRFNKATLLTWLNYASYDKLDADLLHSFDYLRQIAREGGPLDPFHRFILSIYQEKSASSVNDSFPVQIRLLVVYLFAVHGKRELSSEVGRKAIDIYTALTRSEAYHEEQLVEIMTAARWGHP